MGDWLTRLRTKPKAVRKQVAFVGAAVGTLVVLLLWLAAAPLNGFPAGSNNPPAEESSGAFAQFKDRVGQQMSSLWSSFEPFLASSTPATTTNNLTDEKVAAPAYQPVVIPQLNSSSSPARASSRTVIIATSSAATTSTTD